MIMPIPVDVLMRHFQSMFEDTFVSIHNTINRKTFQPILLVCTTANNYCFPWELVENMKDKRYTIADYIIEDINEV